MEFKVIAPRARNRRLPIGLRDITKEKSARRKASSGSSEGKDPAFVDRLEKTALKSIDQLANEFSKFVEKIEEKKRGSLFETILNTVLPDASFSTDDESELALVDARNRFFRSSTGHKIALLMTAGLIAHIEPRSLVLIDEPEKSYKLFSIFPLNLLPSCATCNRKKPKKRH